MVALQAVFFKFRRSAITVAGIVLALVRATLCSSFVLPIGAAPPVPNAAPVPDPSTISFGAGFVANQGQYPKSIRFVGRLGDLLVAVEGDAVHLVPPNTSSLSSGDSESAGPTAVPQPIPLGIRWLDASPLVQVEGEEDVGYRVSHFFGSAASTWLVDEPGFERVRLRNLYSGIDVVLYIRDGFIEFDYLISPGTNPGAIKWRATVDSPPAEETDDALVYRYGGTELRMRLPVAFQYHSPADQVLSGGVGPGDDPVEAAYECGAASTCGLRLKGYDPSKLLVVDPVLVYSSYYGGTLSDQANMAVTDTGGNIYLVGETWSTGLTIVNGVQLQRNPGKDVFIAKLSASGLSVVSSTYFGGSGDDIPTAARIVGNDLIFVGETSSTDLPGTSGKYQPSNRGGKEGFLARIRFTAPASIGGVTYLGGFAFDRISSLAVDLAGNVYVAGYTSSSNFPVTTPSFGSGFVGGTTDAFVARISPDFTTLHWSGVFGGTGADRADAIALGSGETVWFAGTTSSPTLPTLNSFQPGLLGAYDCFLAQTSVNGEALQFSSYLGGTNADNCYALAVASNGDPVIAGSSASLDFPVTPGAFQTTRAGSYDNVLARVDAQTNALAFATYLGGAQTEAPTSLYVDTDGAFCLAGYTLSTDFPVQSPIQPTNGGSVDGFLSCLATNGQSLLFSTYLGGSAEDRILSVARRSDTWTVASGVTYSTDLPVTANAIQPTTRGSGDFFVTAVNRAGANVAPANVSVSPSSGTTETADLTYLVEDANGYYDVKYFYALIHNKVSNVGGCYTLYNPDLNLIYLLSDDGRYWVGAATPGQNTTLANNQCVIDASKSSVWGHGTRMSVRLYYAFRPGFGGPKSLLMYTQDRANVVAGWQLRGGWSVPQLAGNIQPVVEYMAPNNGSFLSTAFVVRAMDQNGADNLKDLHLLINDSLSYPNSCYVLYNQSSNRLQLLNDSTTQFLGPVTPGVAGILENSSCILSSAYSSAAKSGNTLTLTAYLSFKSAAGGTNNLWTLVSDQSNSFLGWRSQGSITVPIGGAFARPFAESVAVAPADTSLRFTITASDENGGSDIKDLYFLANASLANANGCYLLLRRTTNQAFLLNDAGTAWAGTGTIGIAQVLGNSQCEVNLSSIAITEEGTTARAVVDISFKPSFTGDKSAWLYVEDLSRLVSGWVFQTTFTPPTAP